MSGDTLDMRERGFFAWWGRVVTAHPWVTLAVSVVVTLACLYAALQIKPSTGVQDMLADDQPSAAAFGKILGRYALVDDLIILARTPVDDQDAGSPRSPTVGSANPRPLVAFAQRLDAALQQDPLVAEVRYRPSEQARAFVEDLVVPRGLHYLNGSQREALAQRLTRESMDEQFAQNAAMLAAPGPAAGNLAKQLIRDPLRLRDFLAGQSKSLGAATGGFQTMPDIDAIVSPDGRAVLLRVAGVEPASDLEFTARFMPGIRAAVDAANTDGLRIDYTGAYAIAELSAAQTRSDMIWSVNASILMIVVLFLLVYRHPLALPVLILPVYMGIVMSFGVYALVSGRLTPVTAVVGAVLAGLGVDYCVHYLAHHEQERRGGATDPRRAVVRTLASVGPAILAVGATTVIGFAAVLGSRVHALREFSLLAMLGLTLTLVTALTVLPAALLALERTRVGRRGLSASRFDLARPVRAAATHPRLVGGVSLAVVMLCVLAMVGVSLLGGQLRSPLRFDTDLNALHPHPHPPLEAQQILADVFGASPNSLTILVEGHTPREMLLLSGAVQRRLMLPDVARTVGISGVFGPASLLPTMTQPSGIDPRRVIDDLYASAAAHGFNPGAFDAYADFLRSLLTSPPPTFDDLRPYPELAGAVLPKGETRPTDGLVVVTLEREWRDADERNHAIDTIRAALNGLPHTAGPRRLHDPLREADAPWRGATLTGLSVLGYDTQRAIGGSLWSVMGIADLAVLAWLMLFFRNAGCVVLAVLPAAAGMLVLLAVMSVGGLSLNVVNLIALPLVLGIGVDDGIFLVASYRKACKERMTVGVFIEHLASSGHAITLTSVTIVLGFGSLAFTSVPAIRSLGLLTGLGVGAAWLASLAGLVPMLVLLYRRGVTQDEARAL